MLGMGANGARANGVSARMATLRRPHNRRRALALADQGASSLSNVVAIVLVARAFDSPVALGAFSLALLAYQWVVCGQRALLGEPLLSLYAHEGPRTRQRLLADLYGAALSLGTLCSLVLWGGAVWLGGLSGSALLALALVLPLLMLQDCLRYVFIVDRPGAALAIDTVWLVAAAVVMPLAPAGAPVAWFVLAWGLAGGVGAVIGIVMAGEWSGWPHPWRWLTVHRSTSLPYLGEFVTGRSASHLTFVSLGGIAGLGALGAVQAVITYFGLLNTLQNGLYLAVVPEGVRARGEPAKLRRLMLVVVSGLVGLAVLWTVLGVAVPDSWGRVLLNGTWDDAEKLILPMSLAMVTGAMLLGGFLGVRSLGQAARSLKTRLHSTVWEFVCPVVGALLGGAGGFVLGLAAGRGLAALIWWRSFHQALRTTAVERPVEREPSIPVMSAPLDAEHQTVTVP
jgi:hypothetical protein